MFRRYITWIIAGLVIAAMVIITVISDSGRKAKEVADAEAVNRRMNENPSQSSVPDSASSRTPYPYTSILRPANSTPHPTATPDPSSPEGLFAALSPEEQIVFMDHDGLVRTYEIEVKRARFLIDYLAENTTSSRPEISKAARNASKIIADKLGIKYTALEVLEGCRRIVDAVPPNKRGKKDEIMTLTYLIYLEAKSR